MPDSPGLEVVLREGEKEKEEKKRLQCLSCSNIRSQVCSAAASTRLTGLIRNLYSD